LALGRSFSIVLLLGTLGAGSGPSVSDATACPGACEVHVGYEVDPAFSEQEQQHIADAAAVWERGSGGRVCFQKGGHDLRFIRLEHQRDLSPFDDEWQNHVALNKSGRIWIVPSKVDEPGEYVALVIHEIGHHLGLNHIEDTSATYMHSTINDTPRFLWKRPSLPERDRAEYCSVRGCICAW
jgi:hypothetical protein